MSQSPLNDLQINKDNYSVIITDSGGVIYDNDNKAKGISFSITDLQKVVYDTPDGAFNTGLLYPVTRYFDNSLTKFIIERQPTTIHVKDSDNTIMLPWQIYVFEFNKETNLVNNAWLFFRPWVLNVDADIMYHFPNPITDEYCRFHSNIIENINSKMKSKSVFDRYSQFHQIFKTCLIKYPYQDFTVDPKIIPTDLGIEEPIGYFDFVNDHLLKLDLEKLCLLDFIPVDAKTPKFTKTSTDLSAKHIINYLGKIDNKNTFSSFYEMIMSLIK